MEEYKVLLTTSGIGSRLGDLTKYTNKSLVRVGKRPAISYILDSYSDEIEFVITLGYFGDHVKQYIELAHPNKKVTFVNVDKYEGKGSSLLYSISKAKDHLKCPFIFHACDSIVKYKNTISLENNWIGGFDKTNDSSYRTFNVHSGFVNKINDKGETNYDFDYVGVCGIRDYDKFWSLCDSLLQQGRECSDYDVLDKMLNDKHKFSYVLFENWLDMGNVKSLQDSRNKVEDKFEILDKNDESIFLFDDFVIKFFHNSKIVENRTKRAKLLYPLVPKIIDYKKNFYKYEYSKSILLSEIVTPTIFKELLTWSKEKLWIKKEEKNENFYKKCESFYFNKTKSRIEKFFNDNNIIDEETIINGVKVPKLLDLLSEVNVDSLCNVDAYQFHGDFILDNILYDNNNFVLIDWRQDFAEDLEKGDIYYDLGKLNHNLIFNHDLVNKNNFNISRNENKIICDILVSKNLLDCKNVLKKFCEENNLDYFKVELISSIIWINMSPLHNYPLNLFLFYFGKYNLYLNLLNQRNIR
jgi:NDP-sugar pyrophosphorylase family protein